MELVIFGLGGLVWFGFGMFGMFVFCFFCSPGWRQLQTGRSEETTVSGLSEPEEQELKEN